MAEINWNDIANTISQVNQQINQDQINRGQIIQPWQQFLLPLQINSNAPDVLMQQARDTNENYYGYLQGTSLFNNSTLLYAAIGILFFSFFID